MSTGSFEEFRRICHNLPEGAPVPAVVKRPRPVRARRRLTPDSPEIETFLDRVAAGESAGRVCASDGMPGHSTILRWRRQNSAFAERYEKAREIREETYIDDMVDIADAATLESVPTARLRIDARRHAIANMAAKRQATRIVKPVGVSLEEMVIRSYAIADEIPPLGAA